MTWIRVRGRAPGRRLAFIDEYGFPGSVRQRFAFEHPLMNDAGIAIVENGARQWFRLAARHPGAKLSMPSAAVDDLWHEFVLHTQEYAQFCDEAFGRFLHHVPGSQGGGRLLTTLRMAQEDEGCAADRLPLLFRVDQDVGVPGGRRYLVDCGGRGECFQLAGMICLRHAEGMERRTRRPWRIEDYPPCSGAVGSAGFDGCGGA